MLVTKVIEHTIDHDELVGILIKFLNTEGDLERGGLRAKDVTFTIERTKDNEIRITAKIVDAYPSQHKELLIK